MIRYLESIGGCLIMKTKTIQVNRDSVCMGDDCFSHEKSLTIDKKMTLMNLFEYLIEYIPTMHNVIWAICSDKGICGYIITDDHGHSNIELVGDNFFLINIKISKIMCKYYHSSSFTWTDGQTGECINKYGESLTLLEKVKKENEGEIIKWIKESYKQKISR